MKNTKLLRNTLSFTTLALILAHQPLAFAEESKVKTSVVGPSGVQVDTEIGESKSKSISGNSVIKSEESIAIDPKGLNNKIKTSHTIKDTKNADGSYDKKDSIVHADGTTEVNKKVRTVSNHMLNDGKTVTTTNSKTVDPVGLGNKATIQNKVVEKDDGHGSVTKSVTGSVNGDTVLENTETKTK